MGGFFLSFKRRIKTAYNKHPAAKLAIYNDVCFMKIARGYASVMRKGKRIQIIFVIVYY